MKKCSLCFKNEATETNTHYLTDFIIRITLNENGVKLRDKTLSFDLSSDNPYTKVYFKSATNPDKLEEVLGRKPTIEEEDESKKYTSFSVDYFFCPSCEKLFGKIENEFANKCLPKFRNNDSLKSVEETSITNHLKLFRLFWLMQVWRASVCDEDFELTKETNERLRILILDGPDSDEEALKEFPLSITFLYTDQKELTSNEVGIITGNRPNIIFMNEFIIQFFENADEIEFYALFGLNDKLTYKDYINYKETNFKIKVLSKDKKKNFQETYRLEAIARPKLDFFSKEFYNEWFNKTGYFPSIDIQKEFILALTDFDGVPMGQTLSEERVKPFMEKFINEKLGIK